MTQNPPLIPNAVQHQLTQQKISNILSHPASFNSNIAQQLLDNILNNKQYYKIEDALNNFQLDLNTSNDEKQPIINFLKKTYKHIKSDSSAIKVIKDFIEKKSLSDILGGYPKDGKDFIELYCQAYGIELQRDGTYKQTSKNIINEDIVEERAMIDQLRNSNKIEDKVIGSQLHIIHNTNWTLDYFLATLRLFAQQHFGSKTHITSKAIDDGHTIWFKDKMLQMKQDLYNTIRYQRIDQGKAQNISRGQDIELTNEDLWEIIVDLITDKDKELTKAVLQHFFWQVKRKIINLEVTYHLMPVFVGKQELGKSKFIQAILKLMPYIEAGFEQVLDPASIQIFEQNFVILLDEMQGVKKADIQALKFIITSPTKSARLFHTQKTTVVPQNATFIGAANEDISEMIRDHTGMRRFYQIHFKKIDPDNYDIINNFDWQRLWQSVNEFGPSPILPHKAQLSKVQEEYREDNMSPTEHWLNSLVTNRLYDFTREYKSQELFDMFREFDKANYYGNITHTSWGRSMRKEYKGFKIFPKRKNYGQTYVIQKIDLDKEPLTKINELNIHEAIQEFK